MKRTLLQRCTVGCGTLALMLGLWGCSLEGAEEPRTEKTHPLEVHLQSNFRGESVRVGLDDRVLFDGAVHTDHRLGLATVVAAEEREGPHRLWVDVDGAFRAERRVALEDTLFIGIAFYPEAMPEAGIAQGLFIQVSKTPFGYD